MNRPAAAQSVTDNNFDLIRLFAAGQVAVTHSAEHLGITATWLEWLKLVPGVPVFFFISGYLIYQSWHKVGVQRAMVFVTNRFLRLYPALAVCLLFSVASVSATGYLHSANWTGTDMLTWIVAQLSFMQFYNPDFLRGYGSGVLNGALWTIVVEIQFYALTPIVHWMWNGRRLLLVCVLVSAVALNMANTLLNDNSTLVGKLFHVSFLPWIYMFIGGAIVSTLPRLHLAVLRVPLVALALLYFGCYKLNASLGLGTGNGIGVLPYLALCALVLKLVYTRPSLAGFLLRRNDISYGVYIYHMPVINLLMYVGLTGTETSMALALTATLLLATLSWFAVERPALRLKTLALRRN